MSAPIAVVPPVAYKPVSVVVVDIDKLLFPLDPDAPKTYTVH